MATILETAHAAGVFNTLLAAVDGAGLGVPWRAQAPSPSSRRWMTPLPPCPPARCRPWWPTPPQLARTLKYHVLAGAYAREALVAQAEWPSLEGAPIPIRRSEPFEVKNATVVTSDTACDNGIVHVIDRVILPG
jgi:hypothetical protein